MSRSVKHALLIGLFSIFLMTACSEQATPDQTATDDIRPVMLAQVASGAPLQTRRFPGTVAATQTANLTFRVGGELVMLAARPGQAVTQQQVIAKLDPKDYALAVEQAEARAELAKAQFTRTQQLLRDGIVSQAEFDQAKAEQQMALAALNSARTNLSYTELRAPFTGVVAALHVEPYENIAPQQPVLTLQTDTLIDVSIQVPERLFARVHRDESYQPEIRFDSIPDKVFHGRVKEWNRIADAATNTYQVVFTLAKPEHVNILPGMTAQVFVDSDRLLTGSKQVVRVPIGAVYSPPELANTPSQRYVWVYQATGDDIGTVHRRQVTIGQAFTHTILIEEGLTAGERVVAAGVHQLEEGAQVRPWHRERGL
ncbi:efflux RND transporter periplasmic adaptor subunit [Aliidiomarina taiwanensis]|uniref:Efflux RND transporter periplasmic adaptor subunit n=1 Tax=Aliidiomarina taiwanensis TaxID=946228 RepID=A0A432X7W0_9GAMM|nr:efflux RND transporter periplasmic adaptor subunit [Aliidiomarina taiwanensis]RUO42920.1 efflux RND transporter periplasmic adaptor subunit [Aliidiomarina taiwanensis]